MYKCGWNGCEKAYGTLNHLNAHVTMQSHGPKRTPEGMLLRFLGRQPNIYSPAFYTFPPSALAGCRFCTRRVCHDAPSPAGRPRGCKCGARDPVALVAGFLRDTC